MSGSQGMTYSTVGPQVRVALPVQRSQMSWDVPHKLQATTHAGSTSATQDEQHGDEVMEPTLHRRRFGGVGSIFLGKSGSVEWHRAPSLCGVLCRRHRRQPQALHGHFPHRSGRAGAVGASPSVPMKVRHQTPGNLDLRARKDNHAHAHAPVTDRCRGGRRHDRRP